MTKRFIIIVALLSTVFSAAQEGTSSPYSYYGIGLTKFKGTVENQSMGGLQLFSDSIHLNLRNPAGYGKLRLTTFAVGGSYTTTKLKNENASENASTTSFDYLAIGIPTGKLNFGLGVLPYSTVGYNISNVTDESSTSLTGRGGMNKVFLSAGYMVNKNLNLGVDVNYNFGNYQKKSTVFQREVTSGTRIINRTDLHGFNFNFGADYQAKLNENLQLYTAATYAPEMNITAEKMRNIATISIRTDGSEVVAPPASNITLPEEDLVIPSQFTVGAGLGESNKWFLGAEMTNIGSGSYNFNENVPGLNYFYEDASQYRLGGFYIPEYNALTGYFNRVVYRAGIRYEETGLNISNEGINEFGMSFGLGLPAGSYLSNINLGVEYGQRGTTNSGLLKENFFKFTISLSLNDKWFLKNKID